MLDNGRLKKKAILLATIRFAGARTIVATSRSREISDRVGNVLFNTRFQALRRATNVPTMTVTHELLDNISSMMGKLYVLFGCWQELSGSKNKMWFDGKVPMLNCRGDLLFESCRNSSNEPWKVEIN